VRNEPAIADRLGHRGDNLPRVLAAGGVARIHRAVAVPGPLHARLAPGMRDLDPRDRPVRFDEPDDGAEGLGTGVVPDAEIAVGDASPRLDRGRLGEDEPGAAGREPAQVDHVPVGREPVLGRIFAHRRNHDAVAERDAANGHRAEQKRGGAVRVVRHGSRYVVRMRKSGGLWRIGRRAAIVPRPQDLCAPRSLLDDPSPAVNVRLMPRGK